MEARIDQKWLARFRRAEERITRYVNRPGQRHQDIERAIELLHRLAGQVRVRIG